MCEQTVVSGKTFPKKYAYLSKLPLSFLPCVQGYERKPDLGKLKIIICFKVNRYTSMFSPTFYIGRQLLFLSVCFLGKYTVLLRGLIFKERICFLSYF